MHEEETYASLQWDNPTPNPNQKCLPSNKCSGTWCLVMGTYCIFCMGLLTTSIFLGIKCCKRRDSNQLIRSADTSETIPFFQLTAALGSILSDFITGSLRKIKGSHGYWVGLSQGGPSSPWLWQDGSAPSPDL
ncbi:PREDICTED: C-type lectin domain family 9 member A [Propithecus coquereli]|uniref:C-type lectin domain family 9 member A n=1 Tax=Propithecus coquereli TaxID=379532 RepID=UPI00063F0507|nr:PREDICTED: C-type lectin domain family 9 member A [Propithecus coquereli]